MALKVVLISTACVCLLIRSPAVACVLANWDNVLRAISLASSKLQPILISPLLLCVVAHLDLITEKASGLQDAAGSEQTEDPTSDSRLPATLVRIPAEPREKMGE